MVELGGLIHNFASSDWIPTSSASVGAAILAAFGILLEGGEAEGWNRVDKLPC